MAKPNKFFGNSPNPAVALPAWGMLIMALALVFLPSLRTAALILYAADWLALGIAALTLKTAMQSAWLNVLINLSSLKDKEYADECCHKGEAMLAHAIPLAEECYEKVLKVIEKK